MEASGSRRKGELWTYRSLKALGPDRREPPLAHEVTGPAIAEKQEQ